MVGGGREEKQVLDQAPDAVMALPLCYLHYLDKAHHFSGLLPPQGHERLD